MTPTALLHSARGEAEPPSDLSRTLQALWWDAHGDWSRAHAVTQAGEDTDSAWVHAYLHRREGDLANADYWYRRACRTRPDMSLEEEWSAIAAVLLRRAICS